MRTVYSASVSAAMRAKRALSVRGMMPRSPKAFTPPVSVNVLPLPVWPYAKTVPL